MSSREKDAQGPRAHAKLKRAPVEIRVPHRMSIFAVALYLGCCATVTAESFEQQKGRALDAWAVSFTNLTACPDYDVDNGTLKELTERVNLSLNDRQNRSEIAAKMSDLQSQRDELGPTEYRSTSWTHWGPAGERFRNLLKKR